MLSPGQGYGGGPVQPGPPGPGRHRGRHAGRGPGRADSSEPAPEPGYGGARPDPFDAFGADPYAADFAPTGQHPAADPYLPDPFASTGQYSAADSFPRDPYAADPYAPDSYTSDAYATDPYGSAPGSYGAPPSAPPRPPGPPRPAGKAKAGPGGKAKAGPGGKKKTGAGQKPDLATEITASFVVFLVALPLCIGVAVASSAPPELGIISGVVGGLVVGMARGSTLQVSGPAAGLAALVAEAVLEHGLATLGVIVLASGVLQIGLGLIRLGRMFQAISIAVVQGMLAGIGLPLMFSQAYPMADAKAIGVPVENMLGIPGLIASTLADPQKMIAAALGIGTVVLSFLWKKMPAPVNKAPAALVAVAGGMAVASLPGVNINTLQVGNLLASVQVPGPSQFAMLANGAVLSTVLTFTIIASAESLFTAAAVDRMHTGARTRYNSELIAQGAGNTICGLLGALPMTAVVARSSANVQAGAKTRISRTLHGLWLLAFAVLLPGVLALIPISVLAGVLVHSGWKLFAPAEFPKMWRQDRGEFAVMTLTTVVIVATALLEGVLVGLAAGIVLAALRMSQTSVRTEVAGDTAKLVMAGNATFLRLPKLIDALEEVASAGMPRIRLDLTAVTHWDHACRSQVDEFVAQQRGTGEVRVELLRPNTPNAPTPPPTPAAEQEPRADQEATPGPTAQWFYLDPTPVEEYRPSARMR
ncbi:SulP family inorganic anion transporter [Streptomyces sp. NPDC059255]|uniref:SulP family inorganic anion transporter n=1 Tax=Streptomyces sp. NPDC059255 TaxID=3346793 RepID=UPI00368DA688